MARLRREHHRLLANGFSTRPPELDCAFETICETCTFFQIGIEFDPPWNANATTRPRTTSPTVPTCSAGSSLALTNKPHDRLDSDYPHSGAMRAAVL